VDGLRVRRLPRAVLRFRGGTAPTPYEGFKHGFKPVSGPSKLRVCVMFEPDVKREAEEFCYNLERGVRGFGGLGDWFMVEPEWIWVRVGEDGFEEAANCVEELNPDLALAFIPDSMVVSYEDDPYMPLKRKLSAVGLPSQMVERSTLENLRGSEYVLFNVALSIYAKAGGVPWTLDDALTHHLTVGINVSERKHGAVAACYTHGSGESMKFDWATAPASLDMLGEAVFQVVGWAAENYIDSLGGPPSSVAIHVDAASPILEAGFGAAIQRLESEGLLKEKAVYSVVSINKSGPPRVYVKMGDTFMMPDKGACTVLDYERGVVCTSGYPEQPALSPLGVVKPLMVEVVESNYEHSITEIMRDVYWLSEIHWASGFRTPRLPVTLLYPGRMCSFFRAGVKPTSLRGTAWFL